VPFLAPATGTPFSAPGPNSRRLPSRMYRKAHAVAPAFPTIRQSPPPSPTQADTDRYQCLGLLRASVTAAATERPFAIGGPRPTMISTTSPL
jgi:hypothetical protein